MDAAGARTLMGVPAQEIRADASGLVEDLGRLIGLQEALRQRAKSQAAQILHRQSMTRMAATPVLSLGDAVPRGTRLGALANSRFTTIGMVLGHSTSDLAQVPGVGPVTAEAVRAAAARAAADTRAREVIRFDIATRPNDQADLLSTLIEIRRADSTIPELRAPAETMAGQLRPLLTASARSGSKVKMLFSRGVAKRQTLKALAGLAGLLKSPATAELRSAVRQALDYIPPDPELDPWAEYRRDAAGINTLMDVITGSSHHTGASAASAAPAPARIGRGDLDGPSDETDARFGRIPVEQAGLVQRVELDTSLMRSALRGYQEFGAKYALLQQKTILGDEMGLGKTIQAIAVAAHLAAKGQGRALVVCPASVVVNWRHEIVAHSRLTTFLMHGAERDRATQDWLGRGGVGITTFNTLHRLPIPNDSTFALVVIDEAHMIKRPQTQRATAAQRVLAAADRSMLLTGTPMENRVGEFRNLIGFQNRTVARQLAGHGVSDLDARAFRRTVAPVYLRRNQIDVLAELPDKIEVEDWVEPTPEDTRLYREAALSGNFMAMRQAGYGAAAAERSAKMQRLVEIVEEAVLDGRKVIVFSYFLRVLDAVAGAIGQRALGPLTGALSSQERQELVDRFTNRPDPCVLVSQIEAGGIGLNVQAASVVIITEPQLKPTTETQAIARAHRMGQVDTVLVHRLLAKDSVDERIRELLDRKTELFDAYARPSDAKDAHAGAVDGSIIPSGTSRETVSMVKSILTTERRRLGFE